MTRSGSTRSSTPTSVQASPNPSHATGQPNRINVGARTSRPPSRWSPARSRTSPTSEATNRPEGLTGGGDRPVPEPGRAATRVDGPGQVARDRQHDRGTATRPAASLCRAQQPSVATSTRSDRDHRQRQRLDEVAGPVRRNRLGDDVRPGERPQPAAQERRGRRQARWRVEVGVDGATDQVEAVARPEVRLLENREHLGLVSGPPATADTAEAGPHRPVRGTWSSAAASRNSRQDHAGLTECDRQRTEHHVRRVDGQDAVRDRPRSPGDPSTGRPGRTARRPA